MTNPTNPKPYLLFFFTCLLSFQALCQCPEYISFSTQEKMDEFPVDYPNCTVISRDLEISGSVENLLGLKNIRTIEGDLLIKEVPNLTSLSGLENLNSVEFLGLVTLDNLTDLSALNNLVTAESILIKETAATQLPSFDKLVSLDVSLRIEENKQLEEVYFPAHVTFDGNVNVIRNPQIKSVMGFNGMQTSVPNPFWSIMIRENDALETIDGFNTLETSDDIIIDKNSNLTQVPIFQNLTSCAGTINIDSNIKLLELRGFNSLKFCNALFITKNSLQVIDGFADLEETENIHISDNPNLKELSSFPSLRKTQLLSIRDSELKSIAGFNKLDSIVYDLAIVNNSVLEIINGFDDLTVCEKLLISSNDKLKELSSFPNLRKIQRLLIQYSELSTISGFNKLDSITDLLSIYNNSLLKEIDGFTNLKSVETLNVLTNPQLSDCRAFCNYRALLDSENWGYFLGNAAGCNSQDEVEASCNDSIAQIQVFDVVLNTFSGDHTVDELEDVKIDIYEGEELKLSYFSDLEGHVEVNLNSLDSANNYRIEASLGADAVVKMKFDQVTVEMLRADGLTIEYPNRLMDSIVSYRDKLNERIIAAPLVGGAVSYNYELNAYDMYAVDPPIADFMEISSNHSDVVEAMKRMGLGLLAMNTYLDDGIVFSNAMAKAFIESNFGLYKFITEMNGMQSVVEKLTEEVSGEAAKQAFSAANLASIKFAYGWIKKFYINDKIAALENDPESKVLGKSIKQFLTAVEAAIFGGDALTETVFQEIIFNFIGQHITEKYYIQYATQDILDDLQFTHANTDIGFPFLVNNFNTIRTQTENSNNAAESNADFYSGYSQDIGNLASFAESVGLGVTVFTLGTGAPLGESLRKFGQGLKAGALSLNGFNFLTYSYRLTSLPSELSEIASQFELNPPYESGQYSPEFISKLLSELEEAITPLTASLEKYKTSLLANEMAASSEAYLEVADLMSGSYSEKLGSMISVITNIASVAHLNGNPDEDLLAIQGKFRQLEAERFAIYLSTLAHIVNPENDTIVQELVAGIDSLNGYMSNINGSSSIFFEENTTAEYPPLITISSVTYPDSFSMAPFKTIIKIKNVGPLACQAFDISLTPNEHITVNSLESQWESLTLNSGEERTFEVEVTPLKAGQPLSIFLEFANVRGIDESIVFNFEDQVLNFDGTSGIVDLPLEAHSRISYPNPAQHTLHIKRQFLDQIEVFHLYNHEGAIVKAGKVADSKIDIRNLPPGIYIITYRGSEFVLSEKVVIF